MYRRERMQGNFHLKQVNFKACLTVVLLRNPDPPTFRFRTMKKTLPVFLLLSALTAPASAEQAPASAGTIEVCIDNIRSSDGTVGIALFNTKKGFPDKNSTAIKGKSVPAGKQCIVHFENVPYGTYAVSVLHDENGNGRMDKGFLGIPKEGFGTSNNPKLKMGPPSFSESRFDLAQEKMTLNINMKYLRDPNEKK